MFIAKKFAGFLIAAILSLSFVASLGADGGKLGIRDCRGCHDGQYRERFDFRRNGDCSSCHRGEASSVGVHHYPQGKDDVEMVLIPQGEFLMGSDNRMPDESPAHKVYVEAFRMDKFEVTNQRYFSFIRETGHRKPISWITGSYRKGEENFPVVYVDWYDAKAYCHWAGKELPTEAQWEKAARGTDGRHFPWGNKLDPQKANMPISMIGKATPVGSYEEGKSPYGLHDMAGNVYEWVEEWYYLYPGSSAKGLDYEKYSGRKNKILKGGSWYDCLSYSCGISAFTYNRAFFAPTVRNNSFGFRCAKKGKPLVKGEEKKKEKERGSLRKKEKQK